jgi:hypothetical protein
MLRPACLLPPKRLLTPRLARRLSATDRGLLPGAPVPTRTGLPPVSLDQLSGRNMPPSLRKPWTQWTSAWKLLDPGHPGPHYTSLKAELGTIATSLARTIDNRC